MKANGERGRDPEKVPSLARCNCFFDKFVHTWNPSAREMLELFCCTSYPNGLSDGQLGVAQLRLSDA